jgi:hypothetical protein
VPALNCTFAAHWPQWLGGLSHVTVGLIATFTSIACIVSADVGAFFVGAFFVGSLRSLLVRSLLVPSLLVRSSRLIELCNSDRGAIASSTLD